jgi:hypothetical protein
MKKSVLARVLGIKVNTLNVNLRDLHFDNLDKEQDGWTYWKRTGFSRTSFLWPNGSNTRRSSAPPEPMSAVFHHRMELSDCPEFVNTTTILWAELFGLSPGALLTPNVAIDKIAKRFKQSEQPLDNARDVMKALLCPTGYEPVLTFTDLYRLLAMFGPPNTIMIKIAALLTCSNRTGKWLTFDSEAAMLRSPPVAAFEKSRPNCLVIRHGDRTITRVFNDPTVDALTGGYVTDSDGTRYYGWEEYFADKPVGIPPAVPGIGVNLPRL